MQDWRSFTQLPDVELARHDVAVLNLLVAQGLPGSEKLDFGRCLQTLSDWTERARGYTGRVAHVFRQDPSMVDNSWAKFRAAALITVLQRDLGVKYARELTKLDDPAFFGRADHVFVHGCIQGPGGTCSSLPVLFASIGRRLGYPLKLARNIRHSWARWDAPGEERFNVECTSQGFVSHTDEYYLSWPAPVPPAEIGPNGLMQSLTRRQELATFVTKRGRVFLENRDYGNAVEAYLHAYRLAPEWAYNRNVLAHTTGLWGKALRLRTPKGFPGITINGARSPAPGLPQQLINELLYLPVLEFWLDTPRANANLWEPLRHSPSVRPEGLPDWIDATFDPNDQKNGPTFTFRMNKEPQWTHQIVIS